MTATRGSAMLMPRLSPPPCRQLFQIRCPSPLHVRDDWSAPALHLKSLETTSPHGFPPRSVKTTRHGGHVFCGAAVAESERLGETPTSQVSADVVSGASLGPFVRRRLLALTSVALVTGLVPPAARPAQADDTQKTPHLPLQERERMIAGDIKDRHYFVTGQMTKSLYREDCFFIDPMNQVSGLDNYILGISLFLDPTCASNELISTKAVEPNIVEAEWTLSGYFRYLPWQPYLLPIRGSTRYLFDDDGLIMRHEESWSISPVEAWRITVTPAFWSREKSCRLYREGKPPAPAGL